MSRDRPPYVAQGTWRSGALHVWGWNGIDSASMAWFYGFRALEPRRDAHRLARLAHLVRRDRPPHHPGTRSADDARVVGAARPARRRRLAVGTPRPRVRVRLDRLVRRASRELARRTVSSGRIVPDHHRRGSVHRGPLGPRPQRCRRPVGRRHARPRSPPRCRRSARSAPAPTSTRSSTASSTASPVACSPRAVGEPSSASNGAPTSRRCAPPSAPCRSPTT